MLVGFVHLQFWESFGSDVKKNNVKIYWKNPEDLIKAQP